MPTCAPRKGFAPSAANWLERVWFGIVPQVMPNFLSYVLLRLEINVRASTIIGAVGAAASANCCASPSARATRPRRCAIIILLFTTIVIIDQVSASLRRRLVGDQAFEFGR